MVLTDKEAVHCVCKDPFVLHHGTPRRVAARRGASRHVAARRGTSRHVKGQFLPLLVSARVRCEAALLNGPARRVRAGILLLYAVLAAAAVPR